MYLNEREEYMIGALRTIAAFGNGQPAMFVLRSYMDERGLSASVEEDVRLWLQRIAEDAIRFAGKVEPVHGDKDSQHRRRRLVMRHAA